MSDYSVFGKGGASYPLTASTANSLLQDADPALYYAIAYFQSVLTTYVGPRFTAELQRAPAIVIAGGATTVAPNVVPFNPAPYLTQDQLGFPLLAVYRQTVDTEDRSTTWMHNIQKWGVEYILPPLTPGQAERLLPLLKAVEDTIGDRIENKFDPGYLSGAQVWQLAGIESIRLVSSSYGLYSDGGNLSFPSWKATLVVKERAMPVDASFQTFNGVDNAVDMASQNAATVLDQVDNQVTFTDVTSIAGVAAVYRADKSLGLRADGQHVNAWTDVSSAGNNQAQATTANQPLAMPRAIVVPGPTGLRPLAAVRFDGLASYLAGTLASMATDAGKTVVVLARAYNTTARSALVSLGPSGDTGAHSANIEANVVGTSGGLFGLYLNGSAYDTATQVDQLWHVHALRLTNTTAAAAIAGTVTYRIDHNVQALTLRSGSGNWAGMSTASQLALGAMPGSASPTFASADTFYVAAYAASLTDAQLLSVETAMRSAIGLT